MPDWLQTTLIVLTALAVLYLLLVAAQLIIVAILRRQYAPTRQQIESAQRDVSNARKRLDQLAPFVASGSREMPFGPLYDQARDLMAKATHSAAEAQRQVAAVVEERIADEPAASALRLVPMTREIRRRLGMRAGARTAAVQLTAFNEAMSRINQLQADIAALPKREKEALSQTRQRAQALATTIEAEARPKQPLTDERETLRQADANITQAERLLNPDAPTEAAAVAAYPLRLQSEEHLQVLDGLLLAIARKRAQVEAALTSISEQLGTHRNEIVTEETGGFARPTFTANTSTLDAQVAALRTKTDAGEYESASTIASDVQAQIAAQSAALAAVRAERARIIGMADKAQRHIATVGQWMAETPAHFELDRTTAAQADLQDAECELQRLAPLEDASAMAASAALDTRIDDGFRKASTLRAEFEAQRHKFDEVANLVNDGSVQTMTTQTRQAAGALGQVNMSYWGELSPTRLNAATDVLAETWQREQTTFTKVVESELPDVLARLQPLREAFLSAGGMHADALRLLRVVETDKALATSTLNDDGITAVLRQTNAIAAGSPSLAEVPNAVNAQIESLRADLAQPAPNFKAILAEAQRLRKEAEAFLADHRGRLQQALESLSELQQQLRAQHTALTRMDEDAHIEFAPLAAPLAVKLDTWLSAYDVAAKAPLDAVNQTIVQGESIEDEAAEMLKRAAEMNRHVGDKMQSAKTALAELNGVLSSAQAGLATMTGTGLGQAGAMLDAARKPMIEALDLLNRLDAPTNRLAPGDALTAVDRMMLLIATAREHADAAHAEIARQVNEIRGGG